MSFNLQKIFLSLITILLIIVTGCSNVIEKEEQLIEVQKHVGNLNEFEDFRKITDNKKVQNVKEILNETDWENAKVSMSRPPDYQFVFQFKNPNIEVKAVLFRVWISPNKEKLEIVQGDNQYAQLTKEQSAIMFEIITGDKIAKLK
ncbi:hypothetical protein [Metabacillus litoralis]|uniref:hypothetical protein n=1 Tax=Metabacillus litoralis TaxID=152268 RepID=UPI00204113B5|nr:hypothetical protein [Metabacillus litoralis]